MHYSTVPPSLLFYTDYREQQTSYNLSRDYSTHHVTLAETKDRPIIPLTPRTGKRQGQFTRLQEREGKRARAPRKGGKKSSSSSKEFLEVVLNVSCYFLLL